MISHPRLDRYSHGNSLLPGPRVRKSESAEDTVMPRNGPLVAGVGVGEWLESFQRTDGMETGSSQGSRKWLFSNLTGNRF